MKPSLIPLSIFLLVMGATVLAIAQVAQPPEPVPDVNDVLVSVGQLVDAVRAGSAIAIAGAIIMILTQLFKLPLLGGVMKKIPARWRIAVPILLGGVAGILANIAGGLPWLEALLVGLFSGPTAVFAHEAVIEAMLGHARTRKSQPSKLIL